MRRPIRRPLRRPLPGRLPLRPRLKSQPPSLLIEANQHMQAGNYSKAASLYSRALEEMKTIEGHGEPRLYFRAGRACILAKDVENGITYLKEGVTLLLERQQYRRAREVILRTKITLVDNGYTNEAEDIMQWFERKIPAAEFGEGVESNSSARKAKLPPVCPACGGRVHPEEVEWIDGEQAVCDFCGNIIQAGE